MVRAMTAVLAATASIALVACGDDDKKSDTGTTAATTATTASAPATTTATGDGSDRAQVAAAVDEYTSAFMAGDTKGACALMSDKAQGQVVQAAKATGLAAADSCETALDAVVGQLTKAQRDAVAGADFEVVSVKGDTAVVETKAQGTTDRVSVVKVDGRWVMDAVG